jgi:CheY-like chemotaxis protein
MIPAVTTHDVLIVEDDEDLRSAVGHVLEEEGCTVRAAGNGADALTLLERDGHPCLILLDLMMPVMNGWQFLEKKKTEDRLAEIPVVVMSAYVDMPGFAAPHLPVKATLKKPLQLDNLLETIDRCCGRHSN